MEDCIKKGLGIMRNFKSLVIMASLLASHVTLSDDIETYRSIHPNEPPNIIFLIDTSGSMAFSPRGDIRPAFNEKSRLSILQSAATKAISELETGTPINLAIMRFDARHNSTYLTQEGAQGGFVLHPFTLIENESSKKPLINSINSMSMGNIGGGTPITESLFEAYRYLKGDMAVYGRPDIGTNFFPKKAMSTVFIGNSNNLDYPAINVLRLGSHPDSLKTVGNNYYYKSPVTGVCQKNHIILFTDGAPSFDRYENANIKSLTSRMNVPAAISRDKCLPYYGGYVDPNGPENGSCSALFSYWLQNTDHFNDESLTGKKTSREIMQNIHVHTVGGFAGVTNTERKLLNDIATYGNPLGPDSLKADGNSRFYYNANNEQELADSLRIIFQNITSSAGNFSAPAVAVNAFNSLEHRDDIYYSVFKPSELPGWSGNIKRYRLGKDGTIFDSQNKPAINPDTGFFKDTAQSFWSPSADGLSVSAGGIANHLSANRNVYTNILAGSSIIQAGNKISENNASITLDMLKGGMPASYTFTATDRINALKWARGLNTDPSAANNLPHKILGDPLHTTPILVTYKEGSSDYDVLFAGTNSGYIHAFNPSENNPAELWAFMPKELLPNLAIYQSGRARVTKAYGIDGPMTVYHLDGNKNRIIDKNEPAFLVASLRRGGRYYYLLDISQRNAPKLAAQISPSTTGFEELGQTWSRMISANVTFNGKKIPVFFFGGGYDDQEDNFTKRGAHSMGNAIYMVSADPATPFQLLWKATGKLTNAYGPSINKMTSSFAADLTLIDNNGDGTVDLVYAADIGGRLWRFDINASNKGANDFAKGDILADFNDDTVAGNIRFFNQPDVAYTEYGFIEEKDTKTNKTILHNRGRYQISIGSGFRASPLSTVINDKIFIINDYDINGAPSQYTTLKLTDLANHSSFASASITQRKNGLYYALTTPGEKVLSNTLTVNNVVYVSTFRPSPDSANNGCYPDPGKARLITIAPITSPTSSEREIRMIELKQSGIPPKPVLLFPPGSANGSAGQSKPVIAVGMETLPTTLDFYALDRVYWREKAR